MRDVALGALAFNIVATWRCVFAYLRSAPKAAARLEPPLANRPGAKSDASGTPAPVGDPSRTEVPNEIVRNSVKISLGSVAARSI